MITRASLILIAVGPLFSPVAFGDEFVLAGKLLEPRSLHCSALLSDGRVFVAGGHSISLDNSLRSAEIYNPMTETSVPAGTMRFARGREPACIALDDQERVLVMGGATARFVFTATAEVYNLSTGEFTQVGNMSTPRTAFTVFKRPDGKVLAMGGIREGGFGSATPNVDLFDPESNTFSLVGTLVGARHTHSGEILESGEILLVGGPRRFDQLADPVAEIYDPESNTSRPTGGDVLFQPRGRSIQTVPLADGRVLVVSGGTLPAEIYNPSTDSFSAVDGSPLFVSGPWVSSSPLRDGRALLLGFRRTPDQGSRRAEIFDSETGEFIEVGPFVAQEGGTGYESQLLDDGSVVVLGGGGVGNESTIDTVERFVPSPQGLSPPTDGTVTTLFGDLDVGERDEEYYDAAGELQPLVSLPDQKWHHGVDVAGPRSYDPQTRRIVGNRQVLAPADGVVVFVGHESYHGDVVMIKHPGIEGLGEHPVVYTFYSHMGNRANSDQQFITVNIGDSVQRGDQIGCQGNSGATKPTGGSGDPAGGTHLHWEIRVSAIDYEPGEYSAGLRLLPSSPLVLASPDNYMVENFTQTTIPGARTPSTQTVVGGLECGL